MKVMAAVVVASAMLAASGCAGQRTSQEISRLKSDIGILDQRVSQIERAGLQQSTSPAWPSTEAPLSQSISPDPVTSAASGSSTASNASGTASVFKPAKREIQQALKAAGFYDGSIDGKIGPKTREAIRLFQQANGLKVDGVVGRQTWERLSPFLGDATEISAVDPLK